MAWTTLLSRVPRQTRRRAPVHRALPPTPTCSKPLRYLPFRRFYRRHHLRLRWFLLHALSLTTVRSHLSSCFAVAALPRCLHTPATHVDAVPVTGTLPPHRTTATYRTPHCAASLDASCPTNRHAVTFCAWRCRRGLISIPAWVNTLR